MKVLRLFKILLYSILILIALVIAALIALPYFFKDDILSFATEMINEQIEAKAEIGDVDISFFRSFPDISVSIESIAVSGVGAFKGVSLAKIKEIAVSVDGGLAISSMGKNIKVVSFEIIQPEFVVMVDKKGIANYDIAKKKAGDEAEESEKEKPTQEDKASDTTAQPFNLHVDHYLIKDLSLQYKDQKSKTYLTIKNFTHKGKVSFSGGENLALHTQTKIGGITARLKSVTYLKHTPFSLDLGVNLNNGEKEQHFDITKADISLAEVKLQAKGKATLNQAGQVQTDIKVSTPNTNFKSLLYLLPAAYKKQIKDLTVKGSFDILILLKGLFDADKKIYPKFSLALKVKDGYVKYPALPESLDRINIDLKTYFPGGKNLDLVDVQLKTFQLSVAKNPIALSLAVTNLISDPNIKLDADASINLSSIKKAVPLPDLKKLKGSIKTRLHLKGRLSYLEKKQYRKFEAYGNTLIKGIEVESKQIPYPLRLDLAKFDISPKALSLSRLDCQIDKSKINIRGSLRNYLGYLTGEQKLDGDLNIASQYIDLDAFLPKEDKNVKNDQKAKDKKDKVVSKEPVEPLKIPGDISFATHIDIKRIKLKGIDIRNLNGSLGIKNQVAYLKKLKLSLFKGSMIAKGTFSTQKELPKGTFSLDVHRIDINQASKEVEMIRQISDITTKAYGKVSSKLSLKLDLSPTLEPILKSVDSKGKLTTQSMELRDVDALKQVGDKLNVATLKKGNAAIQDLEIRFVIKDGVMTLEPFIVKIDQMKLNISGTSKITPPNELDLLSKMTMQRKYLGPEVNSGIDQVVRFAKKNGIPLSIDPNIDIAVKITGPAKEPSYGFLYGSEGATSISQYMKIEAGKLMKKAEKEASKKLKNDLKKEAEKKAKDLLKRFF